MLSSRGSENISQAEVPWRFTPGYENKYDKQTNPNGLISFALAENIHIHQALKEFSNGVEIPAEAFTYAYSTCGGLHFPGAMAAHINRYFNPYVPIEGKHVITAASLTAINSMLGMNLGDPGDAILVSRPIYGRFELDFGNEARLKICYVEMKSVDSFEERVVERYEEAIVNAGWSGIRIRAILISNPSNPLGKCYPQDTLVGLLELCQKHQIHLISDEVYALSVFDSGESAAHPFTSVLSIDTAKYLDDDLCHVTYGMSKDFGAAGLRIGCLITRNMTLKKAMMAISRFHHTSGPALAIATSLLQNHPFTASLLALSRSTLSKGYKTTTQTLQSAGIQYVRGGNAGFFVYADLSPYLTQKQSEMSNREREFELAQRLKDGGVFLHPREEHNEVPGHFRIVFASLTEGELEEGLKRLVTILGVLKGERGG